MQATVGHLQLDQYNHLLPYSCPSQRLRRRQLSQYLQHTFDRVNVLGDEGGVSGHTGCVNALSWARSGELLLSGGDDTTVRIWGIDAADTSHDYPFVCRSVIHTGHKANIFSAQMLPYSSRIATVAGDRQIRVFDIGEAGLTSPTHGSEASYTARQSLVQKLRCHNNRVKRIVTEHSPDLFLTVGEDGTVRQHDLRTPHDCRHEPCPAPLVKVNHELSTLALSPLTPHLFVVAGESAFGYLFDRRHAGRNLRTEWGVPSDVMDASSSLTTCVRRFGKPKAPSGDSRRRRNEHITGARMSPSNGHEVILSYSGDAVHLYSTYDDPSNEDSMFTLSSPLLPSNNVKRPRRSSSETQAIPELPGDGGMDVDTWSSSSIQFGSNVTEHSDDGGQDEHEEDMSGGDESQDEQEEDMSEGDDEDEDYLEFEYAMGEVSNEPENPNVPVVFPRQRYTGARNLATIKDVNFLGPSDEYVASGSDDGNFFIWRKATGTLHGIYEGDGSVVNMIEGHPYLPLVAVSGIDYTVKLFAPMSGMSSKFSRIDDATSIIQTNARPNRPVIRYRIATLLAQARLQMDETEECRNQ